MNAFYEHHQDNIRWHYRCFDRILLNGLIQPFQQPERVVGFFNAYRRLYPVSRQVLRGIALRIEVDDQDARAGCRADGRQVASDRGLADTAFVIEHHPSHGLLLFCACVAGLHLQGDHNPSGAELPNYYI